jgi:hypothetical protein
MEEQETHSESFIEGLMVLLAKNSLQQGSLINSNTGKNNQRSGKKYVQGTNVILNWYWAEWPLF